jgi:hypothetical protein
MKYEIESYPDFVLSNYSNSKSDIDKVDYYGKTNILFLEKYFTIGSYLLWTSRTPQRTYIACILHAKSISFKEHEFRIKHWTKFGDSDYKKSKKDEMYRPKVWAKEKREKEFSMSIIVLSCIEDDTIKNVVRHHYTSDPVGMLKFFKRIKK